MSARREGLRKLLENDLSASRQFTTIQREFLAHFTRLLYHAGAWVVMHPTVNPYDRRCNEPGGNWRWALRKSDEGQQEYEAECRRDKTRGKWFPTGTFVKFTNVRLRNMEFASADFQPTGTPKPEFAQTITLQNGTTADVKQKLERVIESREEHIRTKEDEIMWRFMAGFEGGKASQEGFTAIGKAEAELSGRHLFGKSDSSGRSETIRNEFEIEVPAKSSAHVTTWISSQGLRRESLLTGCADWSVEVRVRRNCTAADADRWSWDGLRKAGVFNFVGDHNFRHKNGDINDRDLECVVSASSLRGIVAEFCGYGRKEWNSFNRMADHCYPWIRKMMADDFGGVKFKRVEEIKKAANVMFQAKPAKEAK